MSNLLGLIVFFKCMCITVYVHAGACSCMWSPDDILRCHHQKYPRRQGLALAPSSPIRLVWLASKLQSPSLVLGALIPAIVLDTLHGFKLGSSCLQDKRFVNWSILALGIEFCRLSNNGPVKRFPYLALTVKLTEAIFLSFMRYCWPCVIFYFLLKHAIFGWLLPYILFS